MTLGPGNPPTVVPDLQRRRLRRPRAAARRLDDEGVLAHLRRCWSAVLPGPPPNPVTGETPGHPGPGL